MRTIALILTAAGLASCSTAPDPVLRSADGQAKYLKAIEGKVAGPAVSCLPLGANDDMQVIDEQTILFRQGSNTVYVAAMNGSCSNLGAPGYALVTRSPGSPGMCSGDIARVVSTGSGMDAGSCVFGTFTPYSRP